MTEDHVKDYNRHQRYDNNEQEYTPGETSATVTKIGMTIITKTENDQLKSKLRLYQDGKSNRKTATLNESNNWTHTWAGIR